MPVGGLEAQKWLQQIRSPVTPEASPGESVKLRVWNCLRAHTHDFERPIAVKLAYGGLVPLTQSDIAKALKSSVQNIHRCLLELEREGWLCRKPIDSHLPIGKGNVQIECHIEGRKALFHHSPDRSPMQSELPAELATWIRKLKLKCISPAKVAALQELALQLTALVEEFRKACRS